MKTNFSKLNDSQLEKLLVAVLITPLLDSKEQIEHILFKTLIEPLSHSEKVKMAKSIFSKSALNQIAV